MGGKVLVPTQEAVQKLVAARLAADVLGVPTILLARTDAEAATLVTSDVDENDKPFLTGERTVEGFYRVRETGWNSRSHAVWPTPNTPIWCGARPVIRISNFARKFAEGIHRKYPRQAAGLQLLPVVQLEAQP